MANIIPSQIRYVWVSFQPDGTINDHHEGSSVIKNGTGDYTVYFANDFLNQYYHASITPFDTANNAPISAKITAKAAGSFRFQLSGGGVSVLGINLFANQPIDPNVGVTVYACA